MYIQYYLLFSFSIYAHFYFFPFKATTSKMLHDKYKNTLNVQCNVLIWTILFDLLYFCMVAKMKRAVLENDFSYFELARH